MLKFSKFLCPLADGRIIFSLTVIFVTVFADQYSKTFLVGYLKTRPGYYVEVTSYLDFIFAWNYGASFGFLRDYYQYSNYLFMGINSIIVLALIYILIKSTSFLGSCAFAMIIGGALGNILDRAARGAVFDFIYFHYGEYSFPAFNLADSFITIGAAIYFIKYYYDQRDSGPNNSPSENGTEDE